MAVTLDTAITDWYTVVEVALSSGTLYLSKEGRILDNNTVYQGRILSMGELRLSAGRLLEPKIITAGLTMTFDNSDEYFSDLTQTDTFAGAAVTVKFGNGTAAANLTTIYTGVVRISGGWEANERTFRINIDDASTANTTSLPTNAFWASAYANVEDKSLNLPIPLVYGDWSSSVGGGLKVPCHQIDSTAGTGGKFKIADHALKTIEKVFNGSTDITSNCSLDAANGEFTITTGTYDELTQTVTANVKGATDDGLTTGTLLQSLPDILDDILQTHMGVAAGNIDSTAFAAWGTNLAAVDYGRRVINTELSSNTIIRELLVDGFADMTIRDGKYFPVYRSVPVAGLSSFRESDIVTGSGGEKLFSVQNDPEDIYVNKCVGDYRFAPTTGGFSERYTKTDAAAITAVGATVRKRLKLQWLYQDSGAEGRVQRQILAYSTATEAAPVTLGPRALTLQPTDLFYLVFGIYDLGSDAGTPFQVRQITPNFDTLEARVTGWNFFNLSSGHWTADSAVVYTSSTTQQKAENGFWTNSAGLPDPPNADPDKHFWF